MISNTTPLLRSSDLTTLLGWHPKTTMRHLRKGHIPGAYRLGRNWYIPKKTVDDLAAGRIAQAQS
jgi:hypothetical protein